MSMLGRLRKLFRPAAVARPATKQELESAMARDWDARARENAMHYVADFRARWDDAPEDFFFTGKMDTEKFLAEARWSAEEMGRGSLLEIGCGVGRMTRHLSAHFANVTALDVSAEMITQAKELNPDLGNVTFLVGNGTDLRPLPDAHFDFALSYIVFQHIPSEAIILGYIRDAVRTLRSGGRFRFQIRNDFAHAETDTYNGASVRVDAVEGLARELGCEMAAPTGVGTNLCFTEFRKDG